MWLLFWQSHDVPATVATQRISERIWRRGIPSFCEIIFNKSENSLVIRTSIIGHEITKKEGLLEWFLNQKKNVDGYKNVIYSGLTTLELSKIIMKILKKNKIFGLYHISSNKISKYNLLLMIKKKYNLEIDIKKNFSIKKKLILN